jgi:tetratricopeptide (TPR) repeat protein
MTDERVNLPPAPPFLSSFLSAARGFLTHQVTRQPVMLALLSVLAVVFFLAVTGLSRAYYAQRESLASRWSTRGVASLSSGNDEQAVIELRAALLYSRDNYTYQLNLAEALLGLKRTSEAASYLINLWDRKPDDGLVNLELARIAAQKGEIEHAERYYHNAIYAAWSGAGEQEVKRRDARLELIELLLRNNEKAQAESEVIALAANLGDDPWLQKRVGDLFVRTLDYERALVAYRQSLKADRHDHAALAGAGLAAFELALYPQAYRDLQAAVTADPKDTESASRLKITELVLQMDPFQRGISTAQRNRIVVAAFAAAGERLKACGLLKDSTSPAGSQPSPAQSWEKMKPRVNEAGLQIRPDLVEGAMSLVFDIEKQTSASCGTPTGIDQALLLIAKLHEGD